MQKLFIILFIFSLTGCSSYNDPLKQEMENFKLESGLRMELIASEPLIMDPVALAFDENRKMYVVEDRGYPDAMDSGAVATTLGQVAYIEDTDGDGKFDHRTTFVSGLTYPNGILPWRGGVFITCAPNIYYFKDTTGDGVADIKKVVLTGFNANQTGQIRVSTPILGLDGWIYISGGLNSGDITSPEHPERAGVSFASGDGRFNPDSYEFQVTGGMSQFGLTFDPYGRRFGCSNRHPVQHIVMEPWELRRNSNLTFTETYENVSTSEAEAKVFPISHANTTADYIPTLIGRSHTGTFTSACGVMVFNGTGLTAAHRGNVFICEPAQNLVQRQIMHPQGVSFRSELPYTGHDFLASSNTWFRPVYLQHGPDGALYVADMHRKVIDHPSYVPEEARPGLDFESGKTDGRIYKIVRSDFHEPASSATSSPRSSSSSADLVKALESEEEWIRATAFRLLVERKDATCVPGLKHLALESKYPETRAQSLWLLKACGSLDEETVKKSLGDKESGVREQAVLLAGNLTGVHRDLISGLVATAADTNIRVRFNTALVLGDVEGPQVVEALAGIAAKNGDDKWMRAAVLSGIGKRVPEFLEKFMDRQNENPVAFAAVMQDLGRLFGNGTSREECKELLKNMLQFENGFEWRAATLLGLAEGLNGRSKIKSSRKGILVDILGNGSTGELLQLNQFFAHVSDAAQDKNNSTNNRITYANLLGYTQFENSGKVLRSLLTTSNSPELQLAAIASLARIGDPRGLSFLTDKTTWAGYTPKVRSAVIAALVSKPEFIAVLFAAIKQGVITAPEISSMDRERLLKNENTDISKQAGLIFKDFEAGGRMKVYQDYRSILSKDGDAAAGKKVFMRVCSVCHTHSGSGGKVGPDLTGINNQPVDALLLHILVPNYEVLPAYQAMLVQTKNGQSISGRLETETENSITLRTAFGTEESILRSNITSLSNSGLSLMPEGLERSMTKDELRNLIAFLKTAN
ncbi:MAG TPA: PVC-type heme-binding CxxCH protein [Flavitalea sp.]|nr:PVC-type heme-binding CxxCH protein [Flavitalea sp.]